MKDADEDYNLTAYASHIGIFHFLNVIPPRKASGTVQRVMDFILFLVQWQFAMVNLDDILIFSKPLEEHIYHVQQVLTLLSNEGVSLTLKSVNSSLIAKTVISMPSRKDPRNQLTNNPRDSQITDADYYQETTLFPCPLQ